MCIARGVFTMSTCRVVQRRRNKNVEKSAICLLPGLAAPLECMLLPLMEIYRRAASHVHFLIKFHRFLKKFAACFNPLRVCTYAEWRAGISRETEPLRYTNSGSIAFRSIIELHS